MGAGRLWEQVDLVAMGHARSYPLILKPFLVRIATARELAQETHCGGGGLWK